MATGLETEPNPLTATCETIGKLEAFVAATEAQRGKALTDEQATELIQTANFAIYWLEKKS